MPLKLLLACAVLVTGSLALLSAADTRCWDHYQCVTFTMKNPLNNGAFDGNYLCVSQYKTVQRGGQPTYWQFVNMIDANETGQIYPSYPLGTANAYTANPRKCGAVKFRVNASSPWQFPMVANPDYIDPVTGQPDPRQMPMIGLPCGYHFIDNLCAGYSP